MREIDQRRQRAARLLVWVFIPMLLAITFHHHPEAEGGATASYCYECAHHIHHDGHLTPLHSFAHDCVLCHLQRLPYVPPVILHLATFVALVHVAFAVSCPLVRAGERDIRSTRAPPVAFSL